MTDICVEVGDGSDSELSRRTSEFLRFALDKGFVDLRVSEDGEFEFVPTWAQDCSAPQKEGSCLRYWCAYRDE